MPRCGCASDQCACVIVQGPNVTVEGTGSRTNPYVIGAVVPTGNPGSDPSASGGVARLAGEIVMYGGSTAPLGWLMCNGQAVNRAIYADLFAAIGTVYGAGDGETTFNVPDMTSAFPIGAGPSDPRGSTGGQETLTLTTANLPAHTHPINHGHGTGAAGGHQHALTRSNDPGGSGTTIPYGQAAIASTGGGGIANDGSHEHTVTTHNGSSGSTGSGQAVENRPPFLAVNFIINAFAAADSSGGGGGGAVTGDIDGGLV